MVIWLVMACQLVLTLLDTNILACPFYILREQISALYRSGYDKKSPTVAYWSSLVALEIHLSAYMAWAEISQRKSCDGGKSPLLFEIDM
jgi:hypothetical protein